MANDRTAPGGMGMLLLALLEGRDMYGYEMIEALRARSNEVFHLKAGTLYPLLHSLEAQGWVTSSDGVANGRTRRYYAITRTAGPPWLNSRRAGTPTPTRCAACWREGIPVARECVNEYLETVGGQIRWRRARRVLLRELSDHIADQAAAFEAEGRSPEEALAGAVAEMGEPEAVGRELDRLHRPQNRRGLAVTVAALFAAGVLLQLFAAGSWGTPRTSSTSGGRFWACCWPPGF